MEGSASSKVLAAFTAAGGKRSAEAAKAAAHKAGEKAGLQRHTVRAMLSRLITGNAPSKGTAKKGKTAKKADAPKRQARKAVKSEAVAPKRQAKKASAVASAEA